MIAFMPMHKWDMHKKTKYPCRTIWDCQEEGSIDRRAAVHNPLLQWWMHIFWGSVVIKLEALIYTELRNKKNTLFKWCFRHRSEQRMEHSWMPDPDIDGIQWLYYTGGIFCWNGLWPLVSIEGRVTTNHFKVFLLDRLYPKMTWYHPDGSFLF